MKVKFLDASEDLWYREQTPDLHDVFEPNYLCDALTQKQLVLGSLIFGDEKWQSFFHHSRKNLGQRRLMIL